jgi:predicted phosphodiesterase
MGSSFAVLADIHANVWALDAVLADLKSQQVFSLFNLGDILYGPLKPRATYERLLTAGIGLTILGNQDRQIYERTPEHPTLDYVLQDLGREPVEWLRTIQPTEVFQDELFLCHGTPSSDLVYLLEDVTSGQPVVRKDSEIVALLGGVRQPVILCGHSHIPRLVQLSTGQLILNPGSVGLPAYDDDSPVPHVMDTFSPHASYAILTRQATGWDVTFRKVAYDTTKAASCARAAGREDWSRRITTGRAF